MNATATFKKIDDVILAVIKVITIVLFIVLTVLLTTNVVLRQLANLSQWLQKINSPLANIVPVLSITWMEEIVEAVFAALVFYGAAAVWILKGHFSAGDWIGKRIKSLRGKAAYRFVVDLIAFAFIAVFFWYSLNLVRVALELSSVLNISKKYIYACMPISGGIMMLYSLKFVVQGLMEIVRPKTAEVKPA